MEKYLDEISTLFLEYSFLRMDYKTFTDILSKVFNGNAKGEGLLNLGRNVLNKKAKELLERDKTIILNYIEDSIDLKNLDVEINKIP